MRERLQFIARTIEEYKRGAITLGCLSNRLDRLISCVYCREIYDILFDNYSDIEVAYALTEEENFNFEANGKPIVDEAIAEMLDTIERYLTH